MEHDRKKRILVVDDVEMERELLSERLAPLGYEIDTAVDGEEAWETLEASSESYRIVILDRMMPRLNGMELLDRMREHEATRDIPVIFQTGAGERDDIVEGIDAGCYYYLIKPYDTEILLSIVRAALCDRERREAVQAEVRDGQRAFSTLQSASFEYRTIQEASELSTLLAWVFPDPERQVIGLSELLINAVEHGNLEIGYEDKTALNARGELEQEIERRMKLEKNRNKKVQVHLVRDNGLIRVTIRDDGKGFDSTRFLLIDPIRAFDTHGRGIAMAKLLAFDDLEYRGTGNEVVATVRTAPQ